MINWNFEQIPNQIYLFAVRTSYIYKEFLFNSMGITTKEQFLNILNSIFEDSDIKSEK